MHTNNMYFLHRCRKCHKNQYCFCRLKIFGWTPIPYTKEEIESEELPMPTNLKTAILKLPTDVVCLKEYTNCLEI